MTSAQVSALESDSSVFLKCIQWRTVQGMAIALPMLLASHQSRDWTLLTPGTLAASGTVLGLALGAASDRYIRTKHGAPTAVRLSAIFTVVGLWLLRFFPEPEVVASVSLVLGFSVGTDWSSLSEICRASLPPGRLWSGMRWWILAFFVGFAIPTIHPTAGQVVSTTVAFIATALLPGLISRKFEMPGGPPVSDVQKSQPFPPADVCSADSPNQADSDSDVCEAEQPEQIPNAHETAEETECDASDCCGGSRKWKQAGFAHGVMLGTVGWIVLMAGIDQIFQSASFRDQDLMLSLANRAMVAAGLVLGALLMFSAAPRTGYAIGLLPFLLFGGMTLVGHSMGVSQLADSVCRFALSVCIAAIHCGLKLMSGELYADCASDPVRTRVNSMSLFAASVLILAEGMIRQVLPSGVWRTFPLLTVLVAGFAGIRLLANPVVSSLGEDNPESPDADELEDVMAVVNDRI